MDELNPAIACGDKISFAVSDYRTRSSSKIIRVERSINIEFNKTLNGFGPALCFSLRLG
jgi:hypothetical protein